MSTNLKQVMAGWMTIVMIISQVQAVAIAQPVELSQLENQQAEKPVNNEVLLDPSALPSGSLFDGDSALQKASEEPLEEIVGADPLPQPVPDIIRYYIRGAKHETDAAMFFNSLEQASKFLVKTLNAAKAGSGNALSLAEIDGDIFEVFGNAVVASYEKEESGLTVYIANDVKTVGGTKVGSIDWRNLYENDPETPKAGDNVSVGPEIIPLDNGSIFNHRLSNATGWIKDGAETTNYIKVMILGPNENMVWGGVPPLPELIGKYKVGNDTYAVYGVLKNRVYDLGDGRKITVRPDATGFLQDGNIRQHYTELGKTQIGHCNSKGICSMASLTIAEGFEQVGSYVKHHADGSTTTYLFLGKPGRRVITLSNGDRLNFDPKTHRGFVKIDTVKALYEDITIMESMRCDRDKVCAPVDYIRMPDGELIGEYVRIENGGNVTYKVFGRKTATETRLNDGRILRQYVTPVKNEKYGQIDGYVLNGVDGGIKTYYRDIVAHVISAQACDLEGKNCEALNNVMGWPVVPGQVLIGKYTQTKREGDQLITRNYGVMGVLLHTEIVLSNGQVIRDYDAGKGTGSIKNGAVTRHYAEINFVETERCDANGECVIGDYMLPEGMEAIGGFTQKVNGTTIRTVVLARLTETEITLKDGSILHQFVNTLQHLKYGRIDGYVLDKGVKTYFRDILAHVISAQSCDLNGENCEALNTIMGWPVVPDQVFIGNYSETKREGDRLVTSNYGVTGVPLFSEILMSNGSTLIFDPKTKEGSVRVDTVKTFYSDISTIVTMRCETPEECEIIDFMIPEGFEVIGGYFEKGGVVGHTILGRKTAVETTLNDGRILHQFVNTSLLHLKYGQIDGYVMDGSIKTYYRDIMAHVISAQACDLEGKNCEALNNVMGWPVLPGQVLIGKYTQTKREGDKLITSNYDVMGVQLYSEIVLANGDVISNYDPEANTGTVTKGAVTKYYTGLNFLRIQGCHDDGMCWMADVMLPEGHTQIGSFSKKVGDVTITYLVTGRLEKTEIALDNGEVLTLLNTEGVVYVREAEVITGYIKNGQLKKNFSDIQDLIISNSQCPTDPNSTMPCTSGAYLQVEDLLKEGYRHLGNYVEVIQSGDYTSTIVHALIAKVGTEHYEMSNGLTFVSDPLAKTGWVREGNVKNNYEKVSHLASMRCTIAVADEPSECAVIDYMIEEGFVTIGGYTVTKGNVTTTYMILGKPTTREITMEDGRILTIDLQKAVVPVITPTNTASIAKKNTPVAYFGSAIPVSAYEESVEQKKKKKRWMNS